MISSNCPNFILFSVVKSMVPLCKSRSNDTSHLQGGPSLMPSPRRLRNERAPFPQDPWTNQMCSLASQEYFHCKWCYFPPSTIPKLFETKNQKEKNHILICLIFFMWTQWGGHYSRILHLSHGNISWCLEPAPWIAVNIAAVQHTATVALPRERFSSPVRSAEQGQSALACVGVVQW